MDKDIQQGFEKMYQEIENLAVMVKDGFDDVDKRFEQVDKRFDDVDKRFDKLEGRVGNLETTLLNQYPNKAYLDDKLADLAAEIGARINQRKDRDNKFKLKIIDIFKQRTIATDDEIRYLENLMD